MHCFLTSFDSSNLGRAELSDTASSSADRVEESSISLRSAEQSAISRDEAPVMIRERTSKSDRDKELIREQLWLGWCACAYPQADQEHFQAQQEEYAKCRECNKLIKPTPTKERLNEYNFDYTLFLTPRCPVELTRPTPIALRRMRQKEKEKEDEEKKKQEDEKKQEKTFATLKDAMESLMAELRHNGWQPSTQGT